MTYDLSSMSLREMTECSARLRGLGAGASSMEEVAQRIVRHLFESIKDGKSGQRACALVRFYKTHALAELPDDLQSFARALQAGAELAESTPCLTLLATAGEEPEWNDRKASRGHRAIPLPSPQVVQQLPMVAQLVKQLGLEVSALVQPDAQLIVDLHQRTFNVFYVPEALGSPHIPAQDDFVVPHKIRSVVGFGGLLPGGELFACILFAHCFIPATTADLFKPLALSAKLAVMPFVEGPVFAA
jgi:two-component system, NtrC family, sensor kinase